MTAERYKPFATASSLQKQSLRLKLTHFSRG